MNTPSTMDDSNDVLEAQQRDAQKSRERKTRMAIAMGAFLLAGLLWALYWFFISR